MIGARRGVWRLEVYDTLPSTSDFCRARAADGEFDGLAVMARRQTQARGSRGRDWTSPPGNLSLSVLMRPCEMARDAGQWSLLAGVALADTLAHCLPDPSALQLKWPNDVLLNRGKLAGILVDSAAGSDGALDWLVIGLGVNLAVSPPVPGRTVACLADVAAPPSPDEFASGLLARLTFWREVRAYEGFRPVRDAWLARAPANGSHVTLRIGERLIGGGFAGLADDGGLLLNTDGQVRAFATGEVLSS